MSEQSSHPSARKPSRRRAVLPGLLRRPAAARFCGVGVSTWDRLTAAGLTPAPIRLGGSLGWSRHELAEWCRRACPDRQTWAPIWQAVLSARRSGRLT